MGKYNFLVVGCGCQGKAVIDDLMKNCEAKHIGIVEPDPDQIPPEILDGFPLLIPITSATTLEDYFKQTLSRPDIILSCAPYQNNMEIMKFAVKNNIPYCDLGGNPQVVEEQAYYCREEIDHGCSPVVPDCGISPHSVRRPSHVVLFFPSNFLTNLRRHTSQTFKSFIKNFKQRIF